MDVRDSKAVAKLLEFVGGALVIATIQAVVVLYLQTGHLSLRVLVASLLVTIIGAFLLMCGLFWHRIAPQGESKFANKLSEWASTPATYGLLLLIAWAYLAVISTAEAVSYNTKIATLRNDEQAIAKVIDRLVMPRHLTTIQQRIIGSFLSQFGSHEFAFQLPANDAEADTYRTEIQAALLKGGWTLSTTNTVSHPSDIPEGLCILFSQTPEHIQKGIDPKNPNANELLQMAFGLAKVPVNGMGNATAAVVTEDRLVVSIGPPRKDSYALVAPDNL